MSCKEWRHIIKMAEKCLFFAKIAYYTTLGHPISTNYTIFRNLRASLIHWTSLFWNLKSSKIQLCKGPPLEIFRSKKIPGNFFMPHI